MAIPSLFDNIAWDSYCPVERLNQFVGQTVTTCGLIIEQRTHHQVTGEPMKFLSLADWTGIVQTELFAPTYRSYGLATVRYPVLEVEVRVESYENWPRFFPACSQSGSAALGCLMLSLFGGAYLEPVQE